MSKFEFKPLVTALRKSGKSLNEIRKSTGLSKSTVSLWCRNIALSELQKKRLLDKMITMGHAGRLKGAQTNKEKKIKSQKEARIWSLDLLGSISERDKLISGIALYWAEGSKAASTSGFIFVNSDPIMIRFMYEWLIYSVQISKEDITAQISINEIHRYRIKKVLNFWSHLLDLPPERFSKTFFAHSIQRKVYQNHDIHYGVLRLSVRRSTVLKYKLLSLIDILKANVAQVVRADVS